MAELDPERYEKLQKLCAEGNRLAEAKDYHEAWERYHEAWKLIPQPQTDWEASTWVLGAIADVCFLGGWFFCSFRRHSTRARRSPWRRDPG
jgi:hypothetical protein